MKRIRSVFLTFPWLSDPNVECKKTNYASIKFLAIEMASKLRFAHIGTLSRESINFSRHQSALNLLRANLRLPVYC